MTNRWSRRWIVLPAVAAFLLVAGAAARLLLAGDREPETSTLRAPTARVSGGLFRGDIDVELEILREAGLVEAVSGGQTWAVSSAVGYAGIPAAQTAKRFTVSWAQPSATSGPWLAVKCRGTQQVVMGVPWEDVTAVSVVVNPVAREVIEFGVTSLPPDPGNIERPVPRIGVASLEKYRGLLEIRDLASGDTETVAPEKAGQTLTTLKCPEGLEDD